MLSAITSDKQKSSKTGHHTWPKRSRLWEKLTLLHYDPIMKTKVLFVEQKKIRSL
ncbi:unnamed protein product [Nyctereutes procyonoides]|uniref:(raccoon dog) hypothetical protein n=1 Tax=Nyctereutes procyonoides TaxID=34880 RepID=A0A811ZB77_NYCPR|nr:unnamed protein product [Nyctereutes procyonoides]